MNPALPAKARPRPITARQQQILDLIKTSIAKNGAPPTRAEIAKSCGFKSANAAEEHLAALERKGFIQLVRSTSRGIRLVSPAAEQRDPIEVVASANALIVNGYSIDWVMIDRARAMGSTPGHPYRFSAP